MKSFAVVSVGLALLVLPMLAGGHAAHGQPVSGVDPHHAARDARDMEKAGVMPHQTYEHIQSLASGIRRGKSLSDPDIDWALTTLKQPSSAPGVFHAQVMALFLDMQVYRTFTASQRQRIQAGVTPLLSSPDKLDQMYAKAVIKRVA